MLSAIALLSSGLGRSPAVESEPAEQYTHGHHESVLRSHVWRTAENSCNYFLPHLRPDDRVLDVGCGPGTITLDLAGHVPRGRVLGVDASGTVLAKASEDAVIRGVRNAAFAEGNAYALDQLDPALLEGPPTVVHAHQVLQHLARPVSALQQMAAALTEGGLLAVRDADYSAMTWYPELPALERWRTIYLAVARHNRGEPDAGRRLLSWARVAGLDPLKTSASTWCFSTPEERKWWGGLWADRVDRSSLGRQAVALGVATERDLAEIATGWRAWADAPDGWFAVLHGELLVRVKKP
jgi:SAM-dependent methyltransferase